MDKIKRYGRDLSLRKSLVLYIVLAVTTTLALCFITADVSDMIIQSIYDSYPPIYEKYYLTNEQGERLGEGAYIGTMPILLSERDEFVTSLCEWIPVITTPIYSALGILVSAMLFYRNKLKEPLAELQRASQKISDNDLDFMVTYQSRDELGQLCDSFEVMRSALARNFSEMWRHVEERKRLNAAFSHDLRTPLTVLKGYGEMLQNSKDEQTRATAATMERHISRLEHYVDSMSRLQRLEDTQPQYRIVSLPDLCVSLYESADMLCGRAEKILHTQTQITSRLLSIDPDFLSQVGSNLISNAIRYARTAVTMALVETESGLLLEVSDDGPGFDETSLSNAADPYFTGEADRSEHFGLGLYICRILCEHHEGRLEVQNLPSGAKVSAFFQSVPPKS